jgi:hypothetical protein
VLVREHDEHESPAMPPAESRARPHRNDCAPRASRRERGEHLDERRGDEPRERRSGEIGRLLRQLPVSSSANGSAKSHTMTVEAGPTTRIAAA